MSHASTLRPAAATMATNAAILNHCGPCCTTLRPMTHTARIAMSHGVEPKRNL